MRLYEQLNSGHTYMIAEMSANHGGSLENALQIVEEAAKAGADCVKIQTYTADTLTIDCKDEAYQIHGGLWDGYQYYQLYQKAMTPWEWHDPIKKKCEEVGVDFLSTPFDKTAVDYLEQLGVEFYKIASFELVDIPLIEYVASKGKPIIMSCGMGSMEEIKDALNACARQGNKQIVLLKCCSQYPAKYEDMKLSLIPDMRERFHVSVGLSDHSFGALAPVVAVSMGAQVIEKHVRLDCKVDSADEGFSMKMSEFADMVQKVRETEIIKGTPSYDLTEHELSSVGMRRSLAAVQEISKGELFTEQNIKSIRPAVGISPKYYSQILGKRAKKDYQFGEGITKEELNELEDYNE